MVVKAFILIDTSPGKARDVAAKIRQVRGVSMAHAVTGPHDIIAIAEAPDVTTLGGIGGSRYSERAGRQSEFDLDRCRLSSSGGVKPLLETVASSTQQTVVISQSETNQIWLNSR